MKRTKRNTGTVVKKQHFNSKWNEDMPVRVFQLAKLGKTNPQIAKALGVGTETVHRWGLTRDEFGSALKTGRWVFDSSEVESALLKKALGYDYQEIQTEEVIIMIDGEEKSYTEKVEAVKDPNGKLQKKVTLVPGMKRKIMNKHYAPDVGALCFWLCNRQPESWRNVQSQKIETTSTINHNHRHQLDLTKLGRSKLEQLRSIVAEATEDATPQRGRLSLSAG